MRHLERQANDIDQASSYGHSAEHRARFANVFRHLVAIWKREEEWAFETLGEEAITPAAPAHSAKRATPATQREPARRTKRTQRT